MIVRERVSPRSPGPTHRSIGAHPVPMRRAEATVVARVMAIAINECGADGTRDRLATHPSDEPSDAELMNRLRDGDGESLAALYDRHAAAVHGLARSILHDDQLAEEVTHDVFLRLWNQPMMYQADRGVFVGWVLRVTRNRAIDLLRRRRERPFAADEGFDYVLAGQLVDPDPDPADQAATHVMQLEVHAALARLTPDQHRLLDLAYFRGLTQREIAHQLDRPLGTVKSQIRTAMQRLAALLAPLDPAATSTRYDTASMAASDEP